MIVLRTFRNANDAIQFSLPIKEKIESNGNRAVFHGLFCAITGKRVHAHKNDILNAWIVPNGTMMDKISQNDFNDKGQIYYNGHSYLLRKEIAPAEIKIETPDGVYQVCIERLDNGCPEDAVHVSDLEVVN